MASLEKQEVDLEQKDARSSDESLAVKEAATPKAPTKEGTPKAYLALVGGFFGLFISFGWLNCIAIFQTEYEVNQLKNYSSSEISWITSTECMQLLYL